MFEFRDKKLAEKIVENIKKVAKEIDRNLILMHVCGTHQDTLIRHGLNNMLIDVGIDVREGPGCPVCVTTTREIEMALHLARKGKTIMCYGDMLKTPGENESLYLLKGKGADIKVVFSIEDAVSMARENPHKEIVFLGVGFETTMPTTATSLINGAPENFSVLCFHRYTPPAVIGIASLGRVKLDGIILPGHVSTVIGSRPWEPISQTAHIPQVIAGFEPIDLLVGIYMLLNQIKEGRHEVEIEYTRAVRPEGNPKAIGAINKVFEPIDIEWRGFPTLPKSGAAIRNEFNQWDASLVHQDILSEIEDREFRDPPGCKCGEVIRGEIHSYECPLFGKLCTPSNPIGPCMVSFEGACAIEYKYGKKD